MGAAPGRRAPGARGKARSSSAPLPLGSLDEHRAIVERFDEELDTDEGWAKYNRHYWLRDWQGFLEWFFSQCFSEPHSTKQIEDCVGWGLDTNAETLIASEGGVGLGSRDKVIEICARIRCPVLVVHGDEDAVRPACPWGRAGGAHRRPARHARGLRPHCPQVRDPVKVNLLIREFVEAVA